MYVQRSFEDHLTRDPDLYAQTGFQWICRGITGRQLYYFGYLAFVQVARMLGNQNS